MRRVMYGAGAVGATVAAVVVAAALTAGADPSQAAPSSSIRTDQAADAVLLLREIEVTEDLFVTDCMGEAGFEFYSVPLSATPDQGLAVIEAQNAYVNALPASEQTRFDQTLGTDEIQGCLAAAQATVNQRLPSGMKELAMTVQLDSVGEVNAVVGVPGEQSADLATDAVSRAGSYESDALLARKALAEIRNSS